MVFSSIGVRKAGTEAPLGTKVTHINPDHIDIFQQRHAEDLPLFGLERTPGASLGKRVDSQTHPDREATILGRDGPRSEGTPRAIAACLSTTLTMLRHRGEP